MKTMLDQIHAGHLPATPHLKSQEVVKLTLRAYRTPRTQGILHVLNKVPDTDTEHFLWQCLMEAEINAVVSIREDADLRRARLEGALLRSATAEAEAARIVRALEARRGAFTEKGISYANIRI